MRNKARTRVRTYGGTFPARFPSSNKYEFCPNVGNKQGNNTLTCNRLHQRSKKKRKSLSLQHFHGPQEKWRSQTSDQFEGLESISGLPSFQDRKFSNSKRLDAGRGDRLIKLHLKEAYHSVPLTPDHQRYLAFLWDGKS